METKEFLSALELTKRVKFVYVTTIDAEGFPETRVMFNLLKTRAKAFESGAARIDCPFASYLGTNTSSMKIAHIRKNDRICLYYSDNSKFEGCMIRGFATEVPDSTVLKAIWAPGWEMYYSGGIDGGDFSVLKFVPEHVRYYYGLHVYDISL